MQNINIEETENSQHFQDTLTLFLFGWKKKSPVLLKNNNKCNVTLLTLSALV